jgi:hypothetical protein
MAGPKSDPPPKPRTDVGYGRPPVHSRFKKGRSGNPRGRPKHSRNLKTIIRQAFTDRITVREGETRRSITKIEGVVLRQVEAALKGNERAALAVLKMASQVGLLEDAAAGPDDTALTSVEQQLIDNLLQAASPKSTK